MLESGDYCSAAQVQQLGFHVHMGLSVECCNGIDVQNWFPVIKRQHVALQSFNDMIVKESTKELKSVQLDLQVGFILKVGNYSDLKNVFDISF